MKRLTAISLLLALVLLMVSCKSAEPTSKPDGFENNVET